ncbi:MAG: helix-turn-helix domain-containing protein [Alphaproteobacteria bacterium]|nr:helix-turn-helix domain-containing protein [Alphaproteobacteria bacterium]
MPNLERNPDRRDLTDFLVTRRARLTPPDVGLVTGPRRRTPGLRREEVAQLAGVGISWYTWFEQGRDIQVSAHFLENLSRALKLDRPEREHLFALAQHRPPPLARPSTPRVSAMMQRMLESYPHPAHIKTPRWDIVAWNAAMIEIFGDITQYPVEERNSMWLVFTKPVFRHTMIDWEADARRVIARFRLDFGRAGNDPAFVELVRNLEQASPEFARWWRQHDVDGFGEGVKRVRHPRHGEIEYEHAAFTADSDPNLRLVLYMPVQHAS